MNRIDNVVTFQPLGEPELQRIVNERACGFGNFIWPTSAAGLVQAILLIPLMSVGGQARNREIPAKCVVIRFDPFLGCG
jgi:hypothetical protein